MPRPTRLVATGHDAEGRSVILEDRPAHAWANRGAEPATLAAITLSAEPSADPAARA